MTVIPGLKSLTIILFAFFQAFFTHNLGVTNSMFFSAARTLPVFLPFCVKGFSVIAYFNSLFPLVIPVKSPAIIAI